ncbi:DHH family phosphoesterase [Clostridia bacterium]|nr:DHH family phosphoesterase [Clostridia bacterium]
MAAIDFLSLCREIRASDGNIMILTHMNPDPDTIGSALGLKAVLAALNKTAFVVCDTPVSQRMQGYFNICENIDEDSLPPASEISKVICVDIAARTMLGKFAESRADIVIDHHYTNTGYGDLTYLDDTASATGEIIAQLAEALEVPLTADIAVPLYCAIAADTGSFMFSNTTPRAFTIAAKLLSAGFDAARLMRLMFQNKSLLQVSAERLAYNELRFFGNGKIAVISMTNEMKREHGIEGVEIEGLNNIPRTVEGVEVGAIIKESYPEDVTAEGTLYRVSLRSNEYVNVAEIAANFGGGGHPRAAGCKIRAKSIDEVQASLIELIGKAL